MELFKTIDIRGLSFFSALQLASQEFNRIKKNGILELIVDKKRNITDALAKWAKNQGYKKYDAWTEILNKEILNKCIKDFNNTEKNLYKNIIVHKIRAITRFTYPATIEARDELISSGILKTKKETVKNVDKFKNKLLVLVNDIVSQ